MKNIIYIITDPTTNLKYLGSKKDWEGKGSYFGSPSIKSKNHPKYQMQQEWKLAIKERPETFNFEIIEEINRYSKLLGKELFYQKKYDVVNSMKFINGAYSRKGFSGIPRGYKRDQERIKKLKEKGAWNKTEEQKNKLSIIQSGKKYSEETNKKKGRPGNKNPNVRRIKIDDIIYLSVNDAAKAMKVGRHTITRRCNKLENYNYLNPDNSIIKEKTKRGIIRKISIDGNIYQNITEAARKTGIARRQINIRLLNPDLDNYYTV